jgi:hypothetical protein
MSVEMAISLTFTVINFVVCLVLFVLYFGHNYGTRYDYQKDRDVWRTSYSNAVTTSGEQVLVERQYLAHKAVPGMYSKTSCPVCCFREHSILALLTSVVALVLNIALTPDHMWMVAANGDLVMLFLISLCCGKRRKDQEESNRVYDEAHMGSYGPPSTYGSLE